MPNDPRSPSADDELPPGMVSRHGRSRYHRSASMQVRVETEYTPSYVLWSQDL